MTSDRGLCGGFNASVVRSARAKIAELRAQGKEVKVLCLGPQGARHDAPRVRQR